MPIPIPDALDESSALARTKAMQVRRLPRYLAASALAGAIHAAWGDLWRNLAWTVPGNIVGGGLLVGLAYAWVGRPDRPVTVAPEPIPEPAIDAPLGRLLENGKSSSDGQRPDPAHRA